jgi:PKD repeat protein
MIRSIFLIFSLLFIATISAFGQDTIVWHGPGGCATPLELTESRGYNNYTNQRQLWKSQVIPYIVDQSVPFLGRDSLQRVFQHFQNVTNLCFIPWQGEAKYLTVTRNAFGSNYSFAEFTGQSINMGDYYQSSITHEICHILGMAHEHQRYDRGNHIMVHLQNVLPNFQNQFNVIPIAAGAVVSVTYDFASIMHYPFWAFSSNGNYTITDRGLNPRPDYNWVLSPLDIESLNLAYPVALGGCNDLAAKRPPLAKFKIDAPAGNTFCHFTQYTFFNQSVGATEYEWSAPGMEPSSGKDSIFTGSFLAEGVYTVSLTARNAFGEKTTITTYTVKECINPSINLIKPHPVRSDVLTFQLSDLVPVPLSITIYDAAGRKIVHETKQVTALGDQWYQLDLPTGLPSANYLLVVEGYEKVMTKLFVIAR